jgi:hypothetical protein
VRVMLADVVLIALTCMLPALLGRMRACACWLEHLHASNNQTLVMQSADYSAVDELLWRIVAMLVCLSSNLQSACDVGIFLMSNEARALQRRCYD